MIIELIHVQNFRCIRDEKLPCEKLTALVGANGSGKSSFLQALNVFYKPNAKCTEDDFYARDTSQAIVIEITFSNLTDNEKEDFSKRIQDDKLTVQKVIEWSSGKASQKYYGSSLKNPEFSSFRTASGQAALRAEYSKLRSGEYTSLPAYKNKDGAEAALKEWEASNSDQCSREREEVQFFGYTAVGRYHITEYTKFFLLPAVRDASEDAADAKGGVLMEIMDLLVRSALAERTDIVDFQRETQGRYRQVLDTDRLTELSDLRKGLNNTLKTYIPDAGIELKWLDEDIDIPMPRADIKLVEHGYPASVERTGHGLQRAVILTLLQNLALAQPTASETGDEEGTGDAKANAESYTPMRPDLIIAIEEPELYQHPSRQRRLFRTFCDAVGRTEQNTQILYSTHSPLFVNMENFDRIRVLRKAEIKKEPEKPKQTEVTYTSIDNVVEKMEELDGKPRGTYGPADLKSRFLTVMTPWMNEGFFADLAVLVEGEGDRAAILAVAEELKHDLDGAGISIVPCTKGSLHKPALIFYYLGIPTYVIWDSDSKCPNPDPTTNHRLLKLCGQPVEDWPDKIMSNFACFSGTLNATLRTEIGETVYDTILESCRKSLRMRKAQAPSNPQAVKEIIKEAYNQGSQCQTLEQIVSQIVIRATLS